MRHGVAKRSGRKMAEIWPVYLMIAPVERSSAIVALTPGFLDRRPRVSSRASGPVDYRHLELVMLNAGLLESQESGWGPDLPKALP